MNKLEKLIDKVICEAIESENKEHTELLKTVSDVLNECEQIILLTAELGFYKESHSSSSAHRYLCKKYKSLIE